MAIDTSFGSLVQNHRLAIGLTQAELATRVGCATITIRKIESDSMRPSTQIAERLAMALDIPLDERANFVRLARTSGLKTPEQLPTPTPPPLPEEIGEEDLTGRAVRGFQLGERIGAGGFGAVYRAVQPGVEREVAVKIILPQYANHPDFIRRFEAEAQLVARLEHPHIVPLYDYWREPDAAFLVMRLLRGGSLKDRLQGGALPLDEVYRVVDQVGAALHTAHRFGVIHRDLKPANILLDEDQNAYLADFGIAKNLGNPNMEDKTQTGAFIGSPAYISPEQIRAESIRPQADIYSLGVLMYEMLTGILPFHGSTPIDYIMQHLNQPLPSLRSVKPELPVALDAVVRKATAKEIEERYEDIPALLAELRLSDPAQEIDSDRAEWEIMRDGDGTGIANPFKGLRPFGEADEEHFFGREEFIQRLLSLLSEEKDVSRFLGVVGPSGSGKSSVVKAGLIPALRRGGLPGSENWFVVDFMPGSHPFEELEAALLRVAVNPPATLLEQLLADERGLLRAVRRILPGEESSELVLVIDQFEELFTLTGDEEIRRRFMDSLITAVMDPRSRLRVIITMRADFTDRPLQYVDFGEMMERRSVFVLPLTPDELEKVVSGPARHVGLALEPGLTARIVRDLGDQPGTLPLLQYALTELFERRYGRKLTLAAYQEIGGVLGALGRRAEEIFTGLDEPAQASARQLFLRLVTLGEGVEDTRRRVLRTELSGLAAGVQSPTEIRHPLEAFGKARLLTFDHDPVTRGPTVEVAHEALLREWPRLRGWLNDSRGDVRLQRILAGASAEWLAADRDAGLLLQGTRLTQLESWAVETTLALTVDERTFLDASLEARRERRATEEARREHEKALEQRSRNYLRTLVGALSLFLVVAIGLAAFAFIQQGRAKDQALLSTSRELAAAAINTMDLDPELGVLLALQALDTVYTSEAEDALHRTLPSLQTYIALSGHVGGLTDIAFSPDGLRVATASRDGTAILWDAGTGQALLTLGEAQAEHAGHGDHGGEETDTAGAGTTTSTSELYSIAFSPDGSQLATGGRDGSVGVWDAETGVVLFTLEADPVVTAVDLLAQWESFYWTGGPRKSAPQATPISTVVFSPDGSLLAAAGRDGSVRLWDVESGKVSRTIYNHLGGYDDYTYILNVVAFSPNGLQLATAGPDYTAIVWDLRTGQKLLTLSGHSSFVLDLAFSPDGTRLASASAEVKVWDLPSLVAKNNNQPLYTLESGSAIVKFNPGGDYLATGGNRSLIVANISTLSGITIWDAASGLELYTLSGHQGLVEALAFSPDGQRVATASGDATARIWEVAPGRELFTLVGRTGGFFGAIWSPDGKTVAASGIGAAAKVWDAASGRELFTLGHASGPMEGLDYSPNGKLIATTGGDYIARIWDAATGKLLRTLQADRIGTVVFMTDERVITGGYDKVIRVWEIATGEQLFTLTGHQGGVHCLDISPDGARLISGGDETVAIVWDLASRQEVLRLPLRSGVLYQAAYSPDGKRIALATGERDTRIYDAATGELLLSLSDFAGTIGGVDWSRDGTRIATGSINAKIWDAYTGEILLTLYGSTGGVGWMGFGPDDTRLVTGSGDGTVRIYLLQLDELISQARSRITRALTTKECQQYLHLDSCPAQP